MSHLQARSIAELAPWPEGRRALPPLYLRVIQGLGWRPAGPAGPVVLRRRAAEADLPPTSGGRPDLNEIGATIAQAAATRGGGLMHAYVASAVEIALEAEALADGAQPRRARTPVHDLVAETVDALQSRAEAAGVVLAYDRSSRWSCTAVTDPGRLRKALAHLILRALSAPGASGSVRIMVTCEPDATRIAVIALRRGPEPGLFDLGALVRLLRGIGAVLVVEPARAGCSPLCIVLPALVAGAAARPAMAAGR